MDAVFTSCLFLNQKLGVPKHQDESHKRHIWGVILTVTVDEEEEERRRCSGDSEDPDCIVRGS